MVVEAGVVTLLLVFRGMEALPIFLAYFVINGVVFLLVFQPLVTGSESPPMPALAIMIVLIDSAVIKLLAALHPFHAESYRGVTWSGSLVISSIANVLSYLVGYVAIQKPWQVLYMCG